MIKFTNNASATLAASINSTVTTIALTAGQGALFPSTGGGDYFYATLVDSSNNLEIVKVTTRAVDNFTVVRAQDGTTAKSFIAGDRIELRPVAAALEAIQTEASDALSAHVDETTGAHVATAVAYTPHGDIEADNVQEAINELDTEKFAKTGGTMTGALSVEVSGASDFAGLFKNNNSAIDIEFKAGGSDSANRLFSGANAGTEVLYAEKTGKVVTQGGFEIDGGVLTFPDGTTQATAAGGGVGGSPVNLTVFTANGTWTKPANLKAVIVKVIGGGGNGGAATGYSGGGTAKAPIPGYTGAGGGGGSGGYSEKRILASALGATETVTIGPAGSTSSFGTHATATGGAAGAAGANSAGAGGAGGLGASGDINSRGSAGTTGFMSYNGGIGGSSVFGGGAAATGGVGANGGPYGGGASGAFRGASTGTNAGGTGASGVVIIEEYF
jgi:hypothetical protein